MTPVMYVWESTIRVVDTDSHFKFTTAAGLAFDASGLLGNTRSSRYAAVVENGVVKSIFVEDEAPSVTVSEAILG